MTRQKKETVTKLTSVPDVNKTEQTWIDRWMSRIIGVIILAFAVSIYTQLVPLTLVFISGYIGVTGASVTTVDGMIFVLTGIALVVPLVVAFLAFARLVINRFIKHPRLKMPYRKKNT